MTTVYIARAPCGKLENFIGSELITKTRLDAKRMSYTVQRSNPTTYPVDLKGAGACSGTAVDDMQYFARNGSIIGMKSR
jgi:hypothetical protein